MAITTLLGFQNSVKWRASIAKTSTMAVANAWETLLADSGDPSGLSLTLAVTANGAVPTDATTTAYPTIPTLSANNYYLSRIYNALLAANAVSNDVFLLYDRLFHCGSYAFNASQTLSSQPSYLGRLYNGSYVGLELWVEIATAMTGALSVTITYTNQDGVTGRTTGAFSLPSDAVAGRAFRIPLQSGDTGVQKIESVTGTVASAGTFNVVVVRPLYMHCQAGLSRRESFVGINLLGFPRIFHDSALALFRRSTSTSACTSNMEIEIVSG